MTRPLRQRHRWIISTLAVLLPIVFTLGVSGRRAVPTMIPTRVEPRSTGTLLWSHTDLWPGRRIITSLRANKDGRFSVEFMFDEVFGPDLLMYSVGGDVAPTQLPKEARLLGAFSDRDALLLPDNARHGRLILYSLASQAIVAVSDPIHLPLP